jgi:hypothetical protein
MENAYAELVKHIVKEHGTFSFKIIVLKADEG